MSNSNTIRRQVAGSQALTLAPISNLGATETNFVLNANGAIPTNPYAGEASPILSGGVIPLSAGATGLWLGTGAVIHISATGQVVTTDSSSTLALKLWQVPASVIAAGGLTQTSQTSFVELAASTVSTPGAAGTFSWSFDARLQLSGTGVLNGQFTSKIDATAVQAYVTLTTEATGVAEADLNFVLSALGTNSHLDTTVTTDEFRIDAE